jgi:MEMO1 family protein
MSLRDSYFSGSFYPSDKDEILKYISAFDEIKKIEIHENIRAIIVPHAGYVYSGFSANLIYSNLSHTNPKRVIVIGPSHRVAFLGASISLHDEYKTPFGNLIIDKEYALKLSENFSLTFIESVHKEHSTEVQMPFIKHYLDNVKVIEIIYSQMDRYTLSDLVTYLLDDKDNLVVISTDLSHFYDLTYANELDSNCLKAIENIDISLLDQCEACGKIGVGALLLSAKKVNLHSKLIDYRTSAWASGDTSRVVGYASAIFY